MNERQAIEKGYTFHGAYSHNKEEMKARAAQLRAEGNQAVVVNTPPSKLSRGYRGMGYSVYWIESAENKAKREEAARRNKLANLKSRRQKLLDEVAEVETQLSDLGYEGHLTGAACNRPCC